MDVPIISARSGWHPVGVVRDSVEPLGFRARSATWDYSGPSFRGHRADCGNLFR